MKTGRPRKLGDVGWESEHRRARIDFGKKAGICSNCEAEKWTEIHHINFNWHDHRRENLRELCRSCHLSTHRVRPECKATGCNRPNKGFGYCTLHYRRFKRHGDIETRKWKNQYTQGNF